MNFGFSEEQELLRSEVRKFLDQRAPLDEVRKISESDQGYSPEQWAQIAELGWLGLTVPEIHGGAGLGWVDLVVLLEETGRSLYPSPLISNTTAIAAIREAGDEEQQACWLPGLADGSRIGTLALLERSDRLDAEGIRLDARPDGDGFRLSGEKLFVPDADAATVFVVPFRTGAGAFDVGLAVLERGAR